ncbi:MAG: S-layer homology domain-containing protein [Syntrophomonas sp.]|nr:S-layer homology domain-containing protein [Syntrophomonas sp.]
MYNFSEKSGLMGGIMLFVLSLCLTLVNSAQATEEVNTSATAPVIVGEFKDVPSTDANSIYVYYLANKHIIKGYPDGGFHPNEGLTRAQAAVVMVKAAGLKVDSTLPISFSDVSSDHWARDYIATATQGGYLSGYPDNSFHPDEILSRAQGISLTLRLSKQSSQGVSLPQLNDMDNSHWAAPEVAVGIASGMVGLSADGKQFLPDAAFTRINLAHALGILLTEDPVLSITSLEGKLKPQTGTITIKDINNQEKTITTETTIKIGDTITTDSQGTAELDYPDGSSMLLKENTQINVKESIGRKYIRTDGQEGTAVESLGLDIKKGTMLGALATKHEDQKSLEKTDNINSPTGQSYQTNDQLIASREGWELLADNSEAPQWWKVAGTKRVKIKVDMPWGVAAVRGTFFMISVSPNGESIVGCLTGNTEVTNGGQTVPLTGNQSTQITQQNVPPSSPAPMPAAVAQQFVQATEWIQTTAKTMDQVKAGTSPPPPAVETPGEVPTTPVSSSNVNVVNQALQTIQGGAAPTNIQAPTSTTSSSGGGGGSNNQVASISYNSSGTYGSESPANPQTINGSVTVAVAGVMLKNMVITGSLILAEGIEDGNCNLQNVTVKGDTIISGGGAHSVYLDNSNLNTMTINKPDNTVHVVAEGNTNIEQLTLDQQAKDPIVDLATGVEVKDMQVSADYTRINGSGHIQKASIDAEGVVMETIPDNLTVSITATIGGRTFFPDKGAIVGKSIEAGIPTGMLIIAQNQDNNKCWGDIIDSNGSFLINNLPPGEFTLTISYQGTNIYTSDILEVDSGRISQVNITFSTLAGAVAEADADAEAVAALPAQSGSPAFTVGTPATVGTQLTVGVGNLGTTTNLTYQWVRSTDNAVGGGDDTNIKTGLTYTPVAADVGKYLIVVATSTDATGTGTVATGAGVARAAYDGAAAAPPTVSGSPTSVQITLTVLGGTYEYAITNIGGTAQGSPTWQSSNVFTGLTASTAYKFESRVAQTETTLASAPSAESYAISTAAAQSGFPAFTAGTPATFGTELTVGVGTLGTKTNLTYTWYRSDDPNYSGTDIQVGTGTTYTPVTDDIGKYLIVVATSTDATGNGTVATSAEVEAKAAYAIAAAIKDTYTITYTLTTGIFDSVEGVVYSNWTMAGADLGPIKGVILNDTNTVATITVTKPIGAVGQNYTVAPAKAALSEVFKAPAAAMVTIAVAALPAQSGSPAFTAVTPATFGTGLTVGMGTLVTNTNLTYTWYRSDDATYDSGTDTQVGTGTTYTPAVTDIGKYLIVVARSTDATGNGTVATGAVVARAAYAGVAATPTVSGSPTSARITLTNLGVTYEYAITDINGAVQGLPIWQSSNVFAGLTASTPYKFKSRVAQTATTLASDPSAESDAINTLPVQSGSPAFTAVTPATFGTGLTVDVGTLGTKTNLTYTWYRSDDATYESGTDTQVGTGTTYTPVVADIGKYLIVVATSTDATGNGTVATGAVVARAAYVGAATTPTVSGSPTSTQITLTDLGETYEYAITDIGGVAQGPIWQSLNVFTELTASTAYKFKSRVAQTETTLASAPSAESNAISTAAAPVIHEVTGSIKLNTDSYTLGDIIEITVTDNDRNTNTSTKQTVNVNISSSSCPQGITVTLTETGNNTGIFRDYVKLKRLTRWDLIPRNLKAVVGDTITATYGDTQATASVVEGITGEITLSTASYSNGLIITLTDGDLNTKYWNKQTIKVYVKSSRTDTRGFSVSLNEIDHNAGVFRGTIKIDTRTSTRSSTLGAALGETITVTYKDQLDDDGDQSIVTATTLVEQ